MSITKSVTEIYGTPISKCANRSITPPTWMRCGGRCSTRHRGFYVSDERAARVLSWIAGGDARMERMVPKRREMFYEIYRRTMALRAQEPDCALVELVRRVVCGRAPEYYLTPQSGYMILRQMRRRRRIERMRQLQIHVKRLQNNLED